MSASYIDPQVQQLMELWNATVTGHVTELSIEDARAAYSQSFPMLGPPAREMHRVEEIEIPGPAGPIKCRILVPRHSEQPLPVVLYFIGGTYVITSAEAMGSTPGVIAAEADCIVMIPEHRLPPEHRFPAAYDDCFAVYDWLIDHAADIGGDPGRIALLGESSAGTLAASVAIDAKMANRPQPVLQVLIEPLTDHLAETQSRYEHEMFLDVRALKFGTGLYFGDEPPDPRASPLRAPELSGLAPAYLVTAELDPLRDEGRAYGARLRAAGVRVSHHPY